MKNSSPKVSVIVPVYNAGSRLQSCLESLINQTLTEIEIILILDCPTDGSDRIAKSYAKRDKRIVVIENQQNMHIGYSRNCGLLIASGEFIGFSDHDDYRNQNMYELLYDHAKKNDLDLVIGVSKTDGDQNETVDLPDIYDSKAIRDFLLQDLIAGGNDISLMPVATNLHPNLYKRNLIVDNGLQFEDTRFCTPEDRIFQIQCAFYAKKIDFYRQALYTHVIHDQSYANNYNYSSGLLRANGRQKTYEFLRKNHIFQTFEKEFNAGAKKEITNALLSDLFRKGIKTFIKNSNTIKKMDFVYNSFEKGSYSLAKYKITGRISRKLIHCYMKH